MCYTKFFGLVVFCEQFYGHLMLCNFYCSKLFLANYFSANFLPNSGNECVLKYLLAVLAPNLNNSGLFKIKLKLLKFALF